MLIITDLVIDSAKVLGSPIEVDRANGFTALPTCPKAVGVDRPIDSAIGTAMPVPLANAVVLGFTY